jgi:hypothetical protein
MDTTIMNELLNELDDVISSAQSTPLEVDLADLAKRCVTRISLLESKLVTEILDEDVQ